ncbi:sulfatase family protein [Reichenbachiella versicolor]|uniref:sulfatase family protein n=1 Tax=Reichenbachiella versicolor TaxID=1821036 RepID=UPI000D6E5B0C|nr:arylsulfatase [Reichenbachiella versicolor]
MKTLFQLLILALVIASCTKPTKEEGSTDSKVPNKPNIVVIYTDDLGYGDVGAYGAKDIPTPNMDKLANEGVRFTNGYASSATCTPSRYALLTGRYPWRRGAKILPGTAPLIIDTAQMTLPKMLAAQGYATGLVGKWHLGLGSGFVNWNERVSPGPNEVGFQSAYYMAATQDRVPTVYLKDGLVENLDPNDPIEVDYAKNYEGQPTGKDNPELLRMTWHHGHNSSIVNGIPRIGYMKGGESAKWVDEDMADNFLARAQQYVRDHKEEPFFLYYAMQQPHVPRTPHPRFVGATDLGPRGDVIVEADWCVGEFVKTLEEEGILENTIIIFSSDNGPVLNDGYNDEADTRIGNHDPKGGLRGGKYSLFEAGTRVPFWVYWKGTIQPKVSDALICQMDVFASIAKLVGSEDKTQDSEELLDVILGKSEEGRENLIIEATSRTALRTGDYIFIPAYEGPAVNTEVNIELGNSETAMLYNLKEDLGQQNNLAESNPELLAQLSAKYEELRGTENRKVEALELK